MNVLEPVQPAKKQDEVARNVTSGTAQDTAVQGFSSSPAPAEQLKIVIVGHVDHGKSTFVGRLFHDTGSLAEGKLEQLQQVAARRGVPFEWANLMDALQSERDQNITIDTAQIWFQTKKRQYVIIDAPGHKEFLKNMITGAANAEAALLLIDAHEGVQENSRRHGYLLNLLGIRQIAVLVNKMDLENYSEARFKTIERWNTPTTMSAHVGESIGITLTEQVFVERGAIAALETAPPYELTRFEARLFWLGRAPFAKGKTYKLKLATQEMDCEIDSI